MNHDLTNLKANSGAPESLPASPRLPLVRGNILYRRVALPIFALLRRGASPERLAWSIAVGLLIGINPALGTTTILCFAAAMVLRLNIAASQLANHLIYPLQLLLLVPFLQLGSRIFHTQPIPFSTRALIESARRDPVELVRRIWRWEWHALLVWALIAALLIPLIALALTPLLRRLSVRLQRSDHLAASKGS